MAPAAATCLAPHRHRRTAREDRIKRPIAQIPFIGEPATEKVVEIGISRRRIRPLTMNGPDDQSDPKGNSCFATAHWSVVRAAGGQQSSQAAQALKRHAFAAQRTRQPFFGNR